MPDEIVVQDCRGAPFVVVVEDAAVGIERLHVEPAGVGVGRHAVGEIYVGVGADLGEIAPGGGEIGVVFARVAELEAEAAVEQTLLDNDVAALGARVVDALGAEQRDVERVDVGAVKAADVAVQGGHTGGLVGTLGGDRTVEDAHGRRERGVAVDPHGRGGG